MKRAFPFLLLAFAVELTLSAQPVTNTFAPRAIMLPMRDGVKLATDLYLPAGEGPFPVVLMRTPYDKGNTGGAGPGAAKLGYAMVIQDTRGRFASEGANLPFNLDDRDGVDTLAWIAKQGWCNGKIGTFGGSALGITQFQLAGAGPTELACQDITVADPNLYKAIYTGGVFRKSLVEDWLRISKFSPRALELWTGHCNYDRYWLARDATRRFGNVNCPALHVGGYYDIFAQGTIDGFNGFQNEGGPAARGKQKLLMGPWTHAVLTDRVGDLTFPNAKVPPNNVQDHGRWWDCYLKGLVNGVADLPAVTYYVMGDTSDTNAPGNVWRTADQWPPVPTSTQRWFLQPDQSLGLARPDLDKIASYIYDPANPVPTLGGYQLTIPAGPKDQRPIEGRADLLVFTSAPLAAPMEVTGRVRVKLHIATDVPDTDFLARLCDVYPDGRSINICEGILRARFRNSLIEPEFMKSGKIYPLEIDLCSTSIIFNRGHRLRLHVTSSSAPGYDPNPNTDELLRWSARTELAHNTIYVARHFPSELDLPVAQ